ncbi:MAG: A/G-specific adenine glycosylase [Candidatus Aminicenantes bacterium]|nr:A/G-specific adenine glycosylase [Candidatus Aminicenantes bacterium]
MMTTKHPNVKKLLDWFQTNQRNLPWRKTKDIYHIWASEVMLQQTQVTTVIPYYKRFLERFPTVGRLARGSEQEVLKLWEGMGYYSRIRNFHRAARQVMTVYDGKIPDTPETFQKLPGVGPYIAAAVLSIALDIPLPAVDGNVMRVYTRFHGIADDIRKNTTRDRIFNELKGIIPTEPPGAAGDFTQAFMELGALICTPQKPRCDACPFHEQCIAFTTNTIDRYPFKSPAGKVPEYKVSIGIIIKEAKFYIQKRPSEGHLGGLWEFPGGKAAAGESPEQTLFRECKEELGCEVEILQPLPLVRHAYSHFKIQMSPFICQLKHGDIHPQENRPFRWITISELDIYPFPGANHKFFPRLKEYFTDFFARNKNPGCFTV